MINLEVIFFQFSAAEGACKQLLVNQSSLSGGFARIVRAVFQFFKIVGRHATADPETNTDRFCSVFGRSFFPDHFSGDNHLCNAVALLCRQ